MVNIKISKQSTLLYTIKYCSIGLLLTVSACSFNHASIEDIEVNLQGQNMTTRPDMKDVCTGFSIDKHTFLAFFEHASIAEKNNLNVLYQKLPCYSSGTVIIENEPYQWTLRAGGIGEFFNEHHRFTKICGIKCCDKVQGIC